MQRLPEPPHEITLEVHSMDTYAILSRRSLLKHAPIAAVATALPATVDAAPALDAADGLSGLALAAVHIERAVEAMAPVTFGRWSVTIHSGDAEQNWSFHQEHDEVARAISLHKRASAAFSAAIDHEEAKGLRSDPRYPGPSAQYSDDKLQIRRQRRMERIASLPQASRSTVKASREEERASLAVILSKPRDAAAQKAKARYMRGNASFRAKFWDSEVLMAAMLASVDVRGL
jgi:hypothetical protein